MYLPGCSRLDKMARGAIKIHESLPFSHFSLRLSTYQTGLPLSSYSRGRSNALGGDRPRKLLDHTGSIPPASFHTLRLNQLPRFDERKKVRAIQETLGNIYGPRLFAMHGTEPWKLCPTPRMETLFEFFYLFFPFSGRSLYLMPVNYDIQNPRI